VQSAPSNEPPTLVVNAGSSSLKMRSIPGDHAVTIERIGDPLGAHLRSDGSERDVGPLENVHAAFRVGLDALGEQAETHDVHLVGHRMVHGGERYTEPVILDDEVLADLDALAPLAPLHNPANLAGIHAARAALPHATHVAVFDTAFHATLPERAYLYALPYELYQEHGIRRYGFHGTSHDVVSDRVAQQLGRPRASMRIVTLHLGNGASAAAVDHGISVDTTMGFTPMEGLVMGTRSGDVDPGILLHLLRSGVTLEELDTLLNRKSGILGLSGRSNDLRDVWAAADEGDARAAAALDVYAYRIRKTVASMAAAMGGIDALVFTGGVGENDARMRAAACESLAFLGIHLDPTANASHGPRIGRGDAPVETWVIPTDEEARIAELARATHRERTSS